MDRIIKKIKNHPVKDGTKIKNNDGTLPQGTPPKAESQRDEVSHTLIYGNPKSIRSITLIELLIAISLLTLILFAGSGIYLSGWNMFREAQFIAQAQRNAVIPMAHMIKNLQMATAFSRIAGPPLELRFTVNPLGTTPADIRRYIFSSGNIQYDNNTTTGGEILIGTHIQSFSCVISHNGIITNITITVTDNNDHNPTSLTSTVEARYGASPPV